MANDTSLTVSLFGRDISLSKSLKDAGDSAKTAKEHFDDIAKKSAIALAAAGGAALLMAKAAAEDEQSSAQLANTLKNVVGASDSTVKSVEDFISKATLSSGIADDKLRPAFQRLVQSTQSVAESQKLTNLAMEIATAKHIEVTDVANALAKAHDGNMGALKRLGISLDESTIKSKDFGKAVDEMGAQFKGSLAANADTAAGKMEIFQNSMNEAKEAIGYTFLPILKELGDTFQKIAPFITEHADLIGKVMMVVIGLTGAIVAINGAIKVWEMTTKAFTAVQAALNVVLNMNPIGLIVIAIAALAAGLIYAYKHSETFRKIVTEAFDDVKKAAKVVADFIESAFKTVWGGVKLYINSIITLANIAIRALNSIDVKVPSWVPLIGGKSFGFNIPEIPKLAEGGIVSRPTVAMIGEAGPEAVVPLNKSGLGMNVTIQVHGSVISQSDLVVKVRDELAQLMRRKGASLAAIGL